MSSRILTLICVFFLVAATGLLAGCTSGASATATQAARTTIPADVGYVQIIVTDAGNNPLTGARVVSQSQPGSQLSVNGITSNGSVTFGPVAPGNYQFAISQANFQSTVAVIEVIGGQSIQVTIGLQKSN